MEVALGGGDGGGAFHGWETKGYGGVAAGCLDLDRGEGGRALDHAGGGERKGGAERGDLAGGE